MGIRRLGKRYLSVISVCALTACGGGGDSPEAASADAGVREETPVLTQKSHVQVVVSDYIRLHEGLVKTNVFSHMGIDPYQSQGSPYFEVDSVWLNPVKTEEGLVFERIQAQFELNADLWLEPIVSKDDLRCAWAERAYTTREWVNDAGYWSTEYQGGGIFEVEGQAVPRLMLSAQAALGEPYVAARANGHMYAADGSRHAARITFTHTMTEEPLVTFDQQVVNALRVDSVARAEQADVDPPTLDPQEDRVIRWYVAGQGEVKSFMVFGNGMGERAPHVAAVIQQLPALFLERFQTSNRKLCLNR